MSAHGTRDGGEPLPDVIIGETVAGEWRIDVAFWAELGVEGREVGEIVVRTWLEVWVLGQDGEVGY